jgi:glycosyltransferase involved in cell wall biosynthesis
MTNKYSLSIIIPVYKYLQNRKYVSELLCKIKGQEDSFFNIIEIILVNDSPEYKLESIFEPIEININIKIINNEKNFGQAFSRNIGKSIAKGDYLHFIDQDDLIDLDFYSNISQVNDLIFTNCYLFNDFKKVLHMKNSKQKLLSIFKKVPSLKFFLIFDNIILSPGQMIIKRNVFNVAGDFPLLNNFGSDDYGFMYKISNLPISYTFSKSSFFYHRLHDSQGKNILNMVASKKEFLNNYKAENIIFNKLCLIDIFPINFIKKASYLFFYNRLA